MKDWVSWEGSLSAAGLSRCLELSADGRGTPGLQPLPEVAGLGAVVGSSCAAVIVPAWRVQTSRNRADWGGGSIG